MAASRADPHVGGLSLLGLLFPADLLGSRFCRWGASRFHHFIRERASGHTAVTAVRLPGTTSVVTTNSPITLPAPSGRRLLFWPRLGFG